ncbi:MAG: nucleotide exchange factor GrpE [Chloroflexi bacterium]|nr:nucleotide exchange factor GrpE [Chloroflexota bacterium]
MSDEIEPQEVPTEQPGSTPLTLEEQLNQAKADAAANLEGWQRTLAEFANARKRMDKQRAEVYTTATADAVSKLLPIIDDFDRALTNVPANIAEHSWFEGLRLVHKKLNGILEGANIERIVTIGQPFDPNVHEAILQEPSDEHESGFIIRELQSGYKVGDRIIRPALVCVAA